ncbi:MAG: succinate dehydrogenase, cytochrome b556 subunit [Verrucomicrobia bacterium]|nr:succinate dehydrogenase, cytochrome b556 subunit [Verrucomicrobiota bacterium]
MRFHWYAGQVAWVLHRISGLAIVLYLVIHIWSISKLSDPATFDAEMDLYSKPLFRLGEVALLAACVFHALNGVRILLVDFGNGARYQRQLFYGVLVLSVIVITAGAIPILKHVFAGGQ